ncbi:VOC family protein [Thermoactinospora rubra]|uniref:VOC family protein n=1 Tax=Thermoactinospora rubra TaxID=1088767 RepID=UPI000A110ABC|nr:VOC family protein [Thermoactinospora rubra]
MTQLDHLVYAVPDLVAATEEFAKLTGVTPVQGGRHPVGTANYLVGLGPAAYLEIIGPDEPGSRPPVFGLDRLTEPRLAAWAVRTGDIDRQVRLARERGHDPGEVVPLSRRKPDGTLLEWRLTRWPDPEPIALVPFLIDWGATAHPAASGLPRLELVSFRGTHPEPGPVRAALAALEAELEVAEGPQPALEARLLTPNGLIRLS